MLKKLAVSALALVAAASLALIGSGCSSADAVREPPSSPLDPLNVSVSRLSNGITVYLSPNDELPQVVTRIGFRTGSIDDPDDKTGLAHYLEHLLFKGTSRLGTVDYAAEKPLLDRIEELYEKHAATSDDAERERLYREIDRLSHESARYSAPNEFARVIRGMGGSGTNAYTSLDRTVYVNTVPSNQLRKWMKLEAERFRDPVFRGFHTELETVFEEYNMRQDRPSASFWQMVFSVVFSGHPASRPIVGLPEHLKNPSPRRVLEHYRKYYVPDNMYIVMSGDFQAEQTLRELEDSFGRLPRTGIPDRAPRGADPVKGESVHAMSAPDYELAMLVWRFDHPSRRELDMLTMIAKVLNNDAAGLLDQDLKIPQKTTDAYCSLLELPGTGAMLCVGAVPASGMKPETAKQLLDAEMEKLKAADFPEWLPAAVADHMRLDCMRRLPDNTFRADLMLDAAMSGRDWQEVRSEIDRMSRITPRQIADFARTRLNGDRFVFYRRSGRAEPSKKLTKPPITPLPLNRNAESEFARELEALPAADLRPEFPDLARSLSRHELRCGRRTVPVASVANRRDDLFSLTMRFATGTDRDRLLGLAGEYAVIAGAGPYSAAQFHVECYRLSGGISIHAGRDQTTVSVSGLDKNMTPLLKLAGDLLTRTHENPEALKKLAASVALSRKVAREHPEQVLFSGLVPYARYGAHSPPMDAPSDAELRRLAPGKLLASLGGVAGFPCRVDYYGPRTGEALDDALKAHLPTSDGETQPPPPRRYAELEHDRRQVFLVSIPNLRQAHLLFIERKNPYEPAGTARILLFNEYYGNGMSSVVFQQLRETKSLAYSCGGSFNTPNSPDVHNFFFIYLSTQADKLPEAIQSVENLGFPVSPEVFADAKESLLKRRAALRWHDQSLLSLAEELRRKKLPEDAPERIFSDIAAGTVEQLKEFYDQRVGGVPDVLLVVGDESQLDTKALEKFGAVTRLTMDQVMR